MLCCSSFLPISIGLQQKRPWRIQVNPPHDSIENWYHDHRNIKYNKNVHMVHLVCVMITAYSQFRTKLQFLSRRVDDYSTRLSVVTITSIIYQEVLVFCLIYYRLTELYLQQHWQHIRRHNAELNGIRRCVIWSSAWSVVSNTCAIVLLKNDTNM